MAQTQLRAVRATGAALGISLSTPDRNPEYTTLPVLCQGSIDVVGFLAARSRVAPATIRAQFDAWRIGGAR